MEEKLSISNVLSAAFGTIGSQPLATLGLAFLIGVLPAQIASLALIGQSAADVAGLFSTTGGVALYLLAVGLSILCSMLVQAVLVRVTVAHARQEKGSIGASLGVAMAKILPLLGLTILMTLALMTASVFLLIPAIILYIMWCVAAPALVAEDIGVFEAFGRSRVLTKGNRWKIFGLFLVVLVLFYICVAIMGIVMLAAGMGTSAADFATGSLSISYLVLNAVMSTLLLAFWGTLGASLYIQLRTAKEGPMVDALADVFA